MATVRVRTMTGWGALLGASVLCACALFVGCGDEADTTASGGASGGTGSGAGGSSAGGTSAGGNGGSTPTIECGGGFAVSVSVSQDSSLDTKEANQPFPWNKRGAMAASSCGDLGLVYLDSSGGVTYAHFTEGGLEGQSVVLSASVWQAPVLFFDSSCAPQGVGIDSGGALIQASPSGPDSWQTTPIDLTPLTGHTVSAIAGLAHGRDGKIHLFLDGSQSGTPRVLHGTLEGDASWSFVSLPAIDLTDNYSCSFWSMPRVLNFAADSHGEAHAAYSTGCELGYAVTSSGAWQQEIVVPMADDRDVPGWDGYVAIDPNDQPAIANGHSTHYSGWSIKSLTLNYYTRSAGSWTSELIADTVDGYAGTDGANFAGAQVQLFFDAYGQPYVAFNDLSSWHITYNYTAVGQIRYATKACGQWFYQTIFQQDGQAASPNPIHECLVPTMTPGSDGRTMLFACAERTLASDTASNNQWSSGSGYPITVRAFLAALQME